MKADNPPSSELQTKPTFVKEQLQRKDRELRAKSNENDRLSREMRRWQEDCLNAREEKKEIERKLHNTEIQLTKLKTHDLTNKNLQQEHINLKTEFENLQSTYQGISSAKDEKEALENNILELKEEIIRLERNDLMQMNLESKIKALEEEIKQLRDKEKELTRENARLMHQLDMIKDENTALHSVKKKLQTTQDNMNLIKEEYKNSENMVTPLKVKVIHLSQKCRNKDNMISRLAAELRHHGNGNVSNLLEEADREQAQEIPELDTVDYTDLKQSNIAGDTTEFRHPLSSPSPSPNDISSTQHQSSGAKEVLGNYDKAFQSVLQHSTPKPYVGFYKNGNDSNDEETKLFATKSIDDFVIRPTSKYLPPVTSLNVTKQANTDPSFENGQNGAENQIYQVVKNYDPSLFSRSGRQDQELSLIEGQNVEVLDEPDSTGYVLANVDGKQGLVPTNYLQLIRLGTSKRAPNNIISKKPYQVYDTSQEQTFPKQYNSSQSPSHLVLSLDKFPTPLHIPSYNNSSPSALNQAVSPQHIVQGNLLQTSNKRNSQVIDSNQESHVGNISTNNNVLVGPIAPPTDFRVSRIIGQNSVLLAWTPPVMDEFGCSQGVACSGYRILIDNSGKQTVSGELISKALVEHLQLDRPHQFTIQTIGTGGQSSTGVTTSMKAVKRFKKSAKGNLHNSVRDLNSPRSDTSSDWRHPDADMSSVLSSSPPDDGERRVFMAIYDYSPAKHSPHKNPAKELTLRTGDIVTTYGSRRKDGFYDAKSNGYHGLVPSSFIEEVALVRSSSQRNLMQGLVGSSNHSLHEPPDVSMYPAMLDRPASCPPSTSAFRAFTSDQQFYI